MATSTLPRTRIPQLNRLQMHGIGDAVIGLALLVVGFTLSSLQLA